MPSGLLSIGAIWGLLGPKKCTKMPFGAVKYWGLLGAFGAQKVHQNAIWGSINAPKIPRLN